ncbi:hypothetical protein SSX86_018726 [Deinandra increscens subsp. villosa]|uniref:F-box domain-containing protein n=1 Tax=Deinandra increscens subsp. villosa TaxID=3103831 RepID=A0AAP0GV05_9ASTR
MEKLGDDVLYNILARLPGKALLRSRCVSKHWNTLISYPCFMKMRSRRMILLPISRPLAVLDDNVPVIDKANSIVRIRSPLDQQRRQGIHVSSSIVGTLKQTNGIVILALTDAKLLQCQLVLYNPLTCVSKALVVMDIPPSWNRLKVWSPYLFGFGDDKIVRFDCWNHSNRSMYTWDVFDLKTGSCSGRTRYLRKKDLHFSAEDAGMFVDGFLYWAVSDDDGVFGTILALDVKEMVFSRIKLPVRLKHCAGPLLGSKDDDNGCRRLCMVTTIDHIIFDLWVMRRRKEDEGASVWSKAHSLTLPFPVHNYPNPFHPICILRSGKILFTNTGMHLLMYDISKDSYERLLTLGVTIDGFEQASSLCGFIDVRSIEYVESLVSPFDLLF